MNCPKCGSSKIIEKHVSIERNEKNDKYIQSHQHDYECEDCWWNWSKGEMDEKDYGLIWVPDGTLKKIAKGEISEEDIKMLKNAQEEETRRKRIWDYSERTGLFDELKKQWEGKGKEDRPCPPVYPFVPWRANPSPYAFPRQWNDGGTAGTPPDQWYVRW